MHRSFRKSFHTAPLRRLQESAQSSAPMLRSPPDRYLLLAPPRFKLPSLFLYFIGCCAEQTGVPKTSTACRVRDVVVHLRIDAFHEEIAALVSADHRVVVQYVQSGDAARNAAVCELHQLVCALSELHKGHVVGEIARVETLSHRSQLRHEVGHCLTLHGHHQDALYSHICEVVSSFRGRILARNGRFPRPAFHRIRRERLGRLPLRFDGEAAENGPRRIGRR